VFEYLYVRVHTHTHTRARAHVHTHIWTHARTLTLACTLLYISHLRKLELVNSLDCDRCKQVFVCVFCVERYAGLHTEHMHKHQMLCCRITTWTFYIFNTF